MKKQQKHDEKFVECIAAALRTPTWDYGDEPWRSNLWDFARHLKRHSRIRNKDGFDAWEEITAFYDWKDIAQRDERLTNEEETCAAFCTSWDAVRYGEGETLLGNAVANAKRHPFKVTRDRTKEYSLFVSVVKALADLNQSHTGKRVVSIPQETFGRYLRFSRQTVSQWCRWAEQDGYIRLAEQYSKLNQTARRFTVLI